MATKTATKKAVQIIGRVEFKSDPRKVIYLTRSSDGVSQYETTMFDGKATGCTCASRKPCYHMHQCEAKEQERAARQHEARTICHQSDSLPASFAAKILPAWVGAMVAKGVLKVPALPIAKVLPRKTLVVDLTNKGTLNGAQQSAGLLMQLPSRKAKAS